VRLQRKILEHGAFLLKKGGVLVYSTCTLNKKENDAMVRSFLKDHPSFELLSEKTVFPMSYDSDGFYMACMRKKTAC
jgi:16S rRNA (cytosine967-C5)-methyltransferase